jgi:hypothetical protein
MKVPSTLMVVDNKEMRNIFGGEEQEVTGRGNNYIMRNFIICNLVSHIKGTKKIQFV